MFHEPDPDHSRHKKEILIIAGLVLGVIAIAAAIYFMSGYPREMGIAVIRIEGVIVTGNYYGDGYTGSEYAGRLIRDAADDPIVEAIVLRINSPGGTPAAAQEIAADVRYAREKKPVVVSMGEIATSSAYYISAYADRIYADPDTLTGGIGTAWTFFDISGWMEQENLSVEVIKSGSLKDMGSEYRPLTDEERSYAGHLVNASYERFIRDVTSERAIERSSVEDARVVRGEEAIGMGLVDEIGNLFDAIDGARELS
ncbi:MAG: signal peptide peptidase SppA [Methanoregulaceae archaeon]|nr:signal peptide peptidase SppA [Methanoregulaceae archaeon]